MARELAFAAHNCGPGDGWQVCRLVRGCAFVPLFEGHSVSRGNWPYADRRIFFRAGTGVVALRLNQIGRVQRDPGGVAHYDSAECDVVQGCEAGGGVATDPEDGTLNQATSGWRRCGRWRFRA